MKHENETTRNEFYQGGRSNEARTTWGLGRGQLSYPDPIGLIPYMHINQDG